MRRLDFERSGQKQTGKDKKKLNQQMSSGALLGRGLDLEESGKWQMGNKEIGKLSQQILLLTDIVWHKDKGKLNQQTLSAPLLGGRSGYGGGGGHSQRVVGLLRSIQ